VRAGVDSGRLSPMDARSVLVVDVGGSKVKAVLSGGDERRRFESGPELSAEVMVGQVRELVSDWTYEAVSVGVPAQVRGSRVVHEPFNLGGGWAGFDFAAAFERPTVVVNDAVMQAVGSYEGGRMLFLGLGTGFGSAMVVDWVVAPMELGHLPFRKATYEDYVGQRGRDRLGKKEWRKTVGEVVEVLTAALQPDEIVLGGGNVDHLDELPPLARRGDNLNAFSGGVRLWDERFPVRLP
jgi:polyphosphate glucokinase